MLDSLLTVIVVTALFAVSMLLYLLPVLIGWVRHVPDIGAVAVINILLGWTLAGWVVAFALALRTATLASPVVQVVQNPPPAPPRPARLPPAGWDGPPGPPPHRPRHAAPPLNLPPGSGEPGGWG
jgi:Superinfection immunity protein